MAWHASTPTMAAAVVVSGIPRSSWWIRTLSAPWRTLAPTFPSPSRALPLTRSLPLFDEERFHRRHLVDPATTGLLVVG